MVRQCRRTTDNMQYVICSATTVENHSFIPLGVYGKLSTKLASGTSWPKDEEAGLVIPNTQQSLSLEAISPDVSSQSWAGLSGLQQPEDRFR